MAASDRDNSQAAGPIPYASVSPDRRALVCPKCGGAMSRGYVADRSDGNVVRQCKWVEGLPEAAMLGEFLTGLRVAGRAQLKVDTYRCAGCGYLESYANDPVTGM